MLRDAFSWTIIIWPFFGRDSLQTGAGYHILTAQRVGHRCVYTLYDNLDREGTLFDLCALRHLLSWKEARLLIFCSLLLGKRLLSVNISSRHDKNKVKTNSNGES